jgi:hypothetical protein
MQRPEPAYTEQSPARQARLTKGGAVRTRIALATALAVIVVPSFLSAAFGGTPAASAAATRHAAITHKRTRDPAMKLMSYDQARQVAAFMTFANAVEAHEVGTYLTEIAYLKAMAATANTMPAAWLPTALCEEGGRDDPTSGYFGIREWNGFEGYPTAGSAPLSVQLRWEATFIGAPPDAPGQCHSY